MSLFRLALVLGLLWYFVPLDEDPTIDQTQTASISPFAAIGAAQATVSDVSQFCDRNASVCETGRDVATIVALKAKAGARMVADYLETPPAEETLTQDAFSLSSDPLLRSEMSAIASTQGAAAHPVPRPRPARL